MGLLRRTGSGRDINRRYYTEQQIDTELKRPVVRSILDLIRFRNTHAAFAGEFQLAQSNDHEICIEWRNGSERARLDVDLKSMQAAITFSADGRQDRFKVVS